MSISAVLRAVDEQMVRTRQAGQQAGQQAGRPADFEHLQLNEVYSPLGTPQRMRLLTPDGELPLRYLDSGMFADVYRVNRDGPVLAFESGPFTSDYKSGKRVTAMAHARIPDNPHLPDIVRYGAVGRDEVWAMPYYHIESPMKPGPAKQVASILWGCESAAQRAYPRDRQERTAASVACVRRDAPPAVAEAVGALALEMGPKNGLEFPSKNLAVDAAGNLVLLDVVF